MKDHKVAKIYNIFAIVSSIIIVLYMTIDMSRYDTLGYHYIIIDLVAFTLALSIIGVLNWVFLSIGFSISYLKNKTISKSMMNGEKVSYIFCVCFFPITVVLSYVTCALLGVEGDENLITRATIPYVITFVIFTIKFIMDIIIYKKANK